MDDTTWSLVETERRTLADLLAGLTVDQWEAASLCTEWRVRDVAAHLAMTPARAPDLGTITRALVRSRGQLWSAGRDVAVDYARRPSTQLVAELRRDAASRRRPVFVVPDNILLDLLVHGQDIAVPLGIPRTVSPRAGEVALHRLWTMGWPFQARRRFRGVKLQAEGCNWSAGTGPEVHGSPADLLLLMTGRTETALEYLTGAGVELIRYGTTAAVTKLPALDRLTSPATATTRVNPGGVERDPSHDREESAR